MVAAAAVVESDRTIKWQALSDVKATGSLLLLLQIRSVHGRATGRRGA